VRRSLILVVRPFTIFSKPKEVLMLMFLVLAAACYVCFEALRKLLPAGIASSKLIIIGCATAIGFLVPFLTFACLELLEVNIDAEAAILLCFKLAFLTGFYGWLKRPKTSASISNEDTLPVWYYKFDKEEFGPISKIKLKYKISSGQIKSTNLVKGPGMSEWATASEVIDSQK